MCQDHDVQTMSPRERFIAALERKPPTGRVPHFELVFFLTMEAFGKLHPCQRNYTQWGQMEEKERRLHRADIADVLIRTAERFEHSAIVIPAPAYFWWNATELFHLIDLIREKSGDRYCLLINSDGTYDVPGGDRMVEFSMRLTFDLNGKEPVPAYYLRPAAAPDDEPLPAVLYNHWHGGEIRLVDFNLPRVETVGRLIMRI